MQGEDAFISAQSALQFSLIIFELASNARKHGALKHPTGRLNISWTIKPGTPRILSLVWQETGGPRVTAPASRGFGTTLIERTGSQAHLNSSLEYAPEGLICRIRMHLEEQNSGPATYFDTRREANRTARPLANAAAPQQQRRRVLVIEDEPLISLELEDILARNNFVPVGPATSVDGAFEAIAKGGFELAMLDGSLHGEGVDEIAKQLSRRNIPFCMVTGFSRELLPPEIERARIPVLRKPVQPTELILILNRLSGVENRPPR